MSSNDQAHDKSQHAQQDDPADTTGSSSQALTNTVPARVVSDSDARKRPASNDQAKDIAKKPRYTLLDQGKVDAHELLLTEVAIAKDLLNRPHIDRDQSNASLITILTRHNSAYTPPKPKKDHIEVFKHPSTPGQMRALLTASTGDECEEAMHPWLNPPKDLDPFGFRVWTNTSQAIIRTGAEGLVSKQAGIRLDTFELREQFIDEHPRWKHRGQTAGISINTNLKDICGFWFDHLTWREAKKKKNPIVNVTMINLRAFAAAGYPILDLGRENRRYRRGKPYFNELGNKRLPYVSSTHKIALWNVPHKFIVGTWRAEDIEQWMEDHSPEILGYKVEKIRVRYRAQYMRESRDRANIQSETTKWSEHDIIAVREFPGDYTKAVNTLFLAWRKQVAIPAGGKHDAAILRGEHPEHIKNCACCFWLEKNDPQTQAKMAEEAEKSAQEARNAGGSLHVLPLDAKTDSDDESVASDDWMDLLFPRRRAREESDDE